MVGQRTPPGVSNSEVEVADIMVKLSIMNSLPPPHGRDVVTDMLNDPIHANKSWENIDYPNGLLATQHCTEVIHVDNPEQGKLNFKLKLGNKSLGTKTCVIPSPIQYEESGVVSPKSQRGAIDADASRKQFSEGIQHVVDPPRKRKLNFKIKLGNRSMGTKTCVIPLATQDQLSGAGSHKSQRDPELDETSNRSRKFRREIREPTSLIDFSRE